MVESSPKGYKALWEKGEIARYEQIARCEQFLLFPLCFQKARKNKGLFGKGLKEYNHTVSSISILSNAIRTRSLLK